DCLDITLISSSISSLAASPPQPQNQEISFSAAFSALLLTPIFGVSPTRYTRRRSILLLSGDLFDCAGLSLGPSGFVNNMKPGSERYRLLSQLFFFLFLASF